MIYTTETWRRAKFTETNQASARVAELLEDIAQTGDAGIDKFSQQWDGFQPQFIPLKAFKDYDLDVNLQQSMLLATARIERFSRWQKSFLVDSQFADEFGEYGQRWQALEQISAYIPGGRYPLISSALMTLIPARVAGVRTRIAMSPSRHEALLAAAALAGATEFLHIGGAQAIAAAAFGYQHRAASQMIVGPGNAYVAAAKAQLQSRVRIDTLAGPSEILMLIDSTTPTDWICTDAMAQAEHGDDATAIIVTTDLVALTCLQLEIAKIPAAHSLYQRDQIQLVHADSNSKAVLFCNAVAPEHLHLCTKAIAVDELTDFGSLFIGAATPVALGDYLNGPNHTLPTSGVARRQSGLSVAEFMRCQTVQAIQRSSDSLYAAAALIADAEGLQWHAKSLRIRTTT